MEEDQLHRRIHFHTLVESLGMIIYEYKETYVVLLDDPKQEGRIWKSL